MYDVLDCTLGSLALLVEKLPLPHSLTMTRNAAGGWVCGSGGQSGAAGTAPLSSETFFESLLCVCSLYEWYQQRRTGGGSAWQVQLENDPGCSLHDNAGGDLDMIAAELMRMAVLVRAGALRGTQGCGCEGEVYRFTSLLQGHEVQLEMSREGGTMFFTLALFLVMNRRCTSGYLLGLVRTLYRDLSAAVTLTVDGRSIAPGRCAPAQVHLARRRFRVGYPSYTMHPDGIALRRVSHPFIDGVNSSVDYQLLVSGIRYLIPDEILAAQVLVPGNELEHWVFDPAVLPCD